MLGIVFFLFIFLFVLGLPIGGVLAFLAILPNIIDPYFPADPMYIVDAMVGAVSSFTLVAVPMFILSGNIMAKGRISSRIFNVFSYFIADKPAGLPVATVITCLFYGAVSGSGPATVAAVGSMSLPVMKKLGYDDDFSVALVAVAGSLGVIIPPSIPFIFYAQVSSISVADMFTAGILPGLLIGFCLIIYCIFYCGKNVQNHKVLREYKDELRQTGFWNIFKDGFWCLLSPIVVLGSIYSGIASPTEVAVISVFYALVLSLFVYKTIKLRDFGEILVNSVKNYVSVLFIIACATAFARTLTLLKASELINFYFETFTQNKTIFLILVNALLLIVGMIIDTAPAIIILTPIFLPIALKYGISPVHLGIIMVVNLAIGFVTPPIGVNLFVASAMGRIDMHSIVKRAVPMIYVFFAALIAITFIPDISLILLK